MSRPRIAQLLLFIFLAGACLGPVLHRVQCATTVSSGTCGHCDHSDEAPAPQPEAPRHDPSTCAICKFAATGYVLDVPLPMSAAFRHIAASFPLIVSTTAPHGAHALPFSCGPPA